MSGTLGGVLCGGVGVFLLGCALSEGVQMRRLRRHGLHTHGVVVDNVRVHSEDGPEWVPVIEFLDQRGHRVEFKPRMRGSGMGLATGLTVPVIYPPHNPQRARVRMWRHMTGPVVVMAFAAAAFLAVGVFIAVN
ncbi:DUF3592 domain-containing protein [Streptomyces mirabilis]|uniref:DUF3592 domain-containing protein n=1 Tax=Streptomyces mirabilis TaxID=68239 RepID=UPI0007658E0B